MLILWILIVEGWRTALGRGDARRWRRLRGLCAMLAAMVLALWLWGLLLSRLATMLSGPGTESGRLAMNAALPVLTVLPFVLIAGLLSMVQVLRFWVWWIKQRTAGLSVVESEAAE